jgi:predicted O-methyltransferase YrrM
MVTVASSNARDPRRCVILVPFLGYIHQECDDGLKELERRGYAVRRVGGYAAIDQARNQMASDALRDGFEETLWIDSDIGFDPDTVERLRAHSLPIVCGIYPQKGKRAVACHVMPGTQKLVFGQRGGLVELLYAGTGFLLVRREAYLTIQRTLKLPMCNERFGQPLIPFFHPMIHPIDDGHWYLAEDYAFCQRARAAGLCIFADTSIRLWHIGPYRYGWEDAGVEPQRYATFTLNLGGDGEEKEDGGSRMEDGDGRATVMPRVINGQLAARELAARFPWPNEKPAVPAAPQRDWLFPATRNFLTCSVSAETRLIVELGSWTGRSTRFLADLAPHAAVVAVDHWEGSVEHTQDPELAAMLPRLFETFLAECWSYRDRIIPLRASSVDGLRQVAEAGLSPNLVYIDADHRFESVMADLGTALDLFPDAAIVGDDWDWEGVRTAVETTARQRNLRFEAEGSGWRLIGDDQRAEK